MNENKEELKKQLTDANKTWKSEMKSRGLTEDTEYAIEQIKNYKFHVKDYTKAENFKEQKSVPKKRTASDGFTPKELIDEINLETLQTDFLKKIDAESKSKVQQANEFIRKKKEHWFQ